LGSRLQDRLILSELLSQYLVLGQRVGDEAPNMDAAVQPDGYHEVGYLARQRDITSYKDDRLVSDQIACQALAAMVNVSQFYSYTNSRTRRSISLYEHRKQREYHPREALGYQHKWLEQE
jgi:hypothetical protein